MRLLNSLIFTMLLMHTTAHAQELTLAEGLAVISGSGRDVMISRAAVDAAKGGVETARAPYLPSVDLYARETWLRNQPEANTPFGPFPTSQDRFTTYGFRATQLIYDFGKTPSNISASKYVLTSKEMEARRAANFAAVEFMLAYLDLLEADKLLRVAREEVTRYEAHRSDTEARYRVGVITKNELLQADVVLADSRQRLLIAENNRSIKASRINSLLQRPLNDDVTLAETQAAPAPGMPLDEAWAVAAAENPEIRDLDARIRSKEEGLSAVRAEFLPSIYMAGGYEYSENRYLVHDDNWSLIAGINLNLFSGGFTSGKIASLSAELKALRFAREKLLDAVRLEVKRAHLDLGSSLQRVEVAKTAVAQAEENLRLQRLRFREGAGTATDVLDAVTLLSTAETNSWKALYGVQRAEASLLYTIGRDLAAVYGK